MHAHALKEDKLNNLVEKEGLKQIDGGKEKLLGNSEGKKLKTYNGKKRKKRKKKKEKERNEERTKGGRGPAVIALVIR